MQANLVFDDAADDEKLYVYIFKDVWESVYAGIRQKAIDQLLKL
jgi:hypothetical protein